MGRTPAPRSPVVGGRYVAAALLGDGHATWHLATSAEAVDRGLTMRSSDDIYSPESVQEQHLAIHLAIHMPLRALLSEGLAVQGVPVRYKTAYWHASLAPG